MTIWTPKLGSRAGPKYLLIAEAIGESIADGSLAERERLPPQRDLAYALGVSLNTVSRAYAEAVRRGFLQGEVGRGTFVRSAGALPPQAEQAQMTRPADGPIDFTRNLPALGESAAALAATLGEIQGSPALGSFLDYQTDGDQARHAAAGARWLAQLGLETSGDSVILTAGAQHGLLVALLATLRPGDVLLTESLTYAPIKARARHLGLKLHGLAMDEGGLAPGSLDAACRATAAKLLYCLPTLQTPTTVTMGTKRRREIAALARKHELVILEDDVFGFLPPERPQPLASFAAERTLFLTSVSKCLGPGLRIGYLHAPEPCRRALRAAVNLSCWMPPPLMAEIASRWIGDGTAERLNRFQRTEGAARQAMARRALKGHRVQADPHGFHLWLSLPAHWRADAFRVAAERRGVQLLTGDTFAVEPSEAPPSVRLCLSHEASRDRVAQGLAILAELLEESGETGLLVM